jgi:signal transduction histidine kinase
MDDIKPNNLSNRLIINSKDELSHLIESINNLLKRVEMAFNAQKKFISNVSHELKNPLTVISSQLEVTLQKDRDNSIYKHTLESVLDDTKELNKVTEKLLQLAKIHNENDAITFDDIRLDELLWQIKVNFQKTNSSYKVNFEIKNIPDDEQSLYVRANESLLRIALTNLIENGCKYSLDRSVRISLDYDESLIVEIKDCGMGISDEDQKRIFEPFFRADNDSTILGSGIGLSIVESVLKMHHVRIEIFSKKDEGTLFRLFF